MIREFIRFNAFLKPALKLLGEKGIEQLQKELSDNPEAGALIRGGGGLRKYRVALPGRGKSGGARLIYYYYVTGQQCYLFYLYPKNERENISADDVKTCAKIIAEIK